MKTLYRLSFYNDEHKKMEIYAEKVSNSDILGLVEADGIVFMESSELIITPEDDKLKKEFKDTVRTFIPINNIIRVDEITVNKTTPVIRLYESEAE